jgi:hypothetical protein
MILENWEYKAEIQKLAEREKELKCLYKVQEIINKNLPIEEFLMKIVKHIWGGWQYPMLTRVKITFEGKVYKEPGWEESPWKQVAQIVVDETVSGMIEVFYTRAAEANAGNPFLPEEYRLLETIARKVGHYIFNLRLINTIKTLDEEKKNESFTQNLSETLIPAKPDIHWQWRFKTVENIAANLDMEKFGVRALFLIGSVKEGTCGPASDIDLLVHFEGSPEQAFALTAWFDGWSLCLAEANRIRTGYKTGRLIDLHIVTDKDIENKDSFASMISSRHNPAKLIRKK